MVEWNEVWQVALLIVCTADFFHRSKESRLVSTRSFDELWRGLFVAGATTEEE
jgi:hypothetical protein